MTVNIGLVTSEALILGCDSIATSTRQVIDPFAGNLAVDAAGNRIRDKDGSFTVALSASSFETVVVDVMPGVSKMFKIYEKNDTFVAATTSGQGVMSDRAISSHVTDFVEHQSKSKKPFANVEAVANAFRRFMKKAWEAHYAKSPVDKAYWTDLNFLVGGFGKRDKMPSLYRIRVKDDTTTPAIGKGEHGVAWGGQSDSVERIIRGYDSILRSQITVDIDNEFDKYRNRVTNKMIDIVNDVLTKLGANMPAGVNLTLPGAPRAKLGWDKASLDVQYGSLAKQRAIDFVSFLVLLQAGPQRFATGIATVGGRTHIGVVSRSGFEMLNEPDLNHEQTGFSDDS